MVGGLTTSRARSARPTSSASSVREGPPSNLAHIRYVVEKYQAQYSCAALWIRHYRHNHFPCIKTSVAHSQQVNHTGACIAQDSEEQGLTRVERAAHRALLAQLPSVLAASQAGPPQGQRARRTRCRCLACWRASNLAGSFTGQQATRSCLCGGVRVLKSPHVTNYRIARALNLEHLHHTQMPARTSARLHSQPVCSNLLASISAAKALLAWGCSTQ